MTNSIDILTSAFNDLKKYSEATFVIQCGGFLLEDSDLLKSFAEDIVALQNAGINIIIVHDGSNIVNNMMEKFSCKSAANTHCIDQASVEIVEMILSGHVNKKIVTQINQAGGSAAGISGKDGHFMIAKRAKIARYDHSASDKVLNFGFLGELSLMNPDILLLLEENQIIPVISPIAIGEDNRTYKIDVDDIAGAVSAVLSATKLIFISDCPGVADAQGQILPEINLTQVNKILHDDKCKEGLNGKLRSTIMALEQNAEMIHIINGKIPHALLMELFTKDPVGTKIK